MAAEQNYPKALNNLGVLHYQGKGVPQDYQLAVEYFEAAAEEGNANAFNNLGICYEEGHGTPRDLARAAKCYHEAATRGNINAVYNLGYIHFLQVFHAQFLKLCL